MSEGKNEAQYLMDATLLLVEQLLLEHNEFYPLGLATDIKGNIVSVAAHNGDDFPKSNELISLLEDAFRLKASNGEYLTTALAYDVKLRVSATQKVDAIAFNLDHYSGYSVIVYLPHEINNGKVEYGNIQATQGLNSIFAK
ncbi:hypothetical protein L4C37_21995 [Vibrio kagoshimensis]|uniref:hypothetical protein n=1 Tax=Vibrio kagoshimensis TaxID=2910244 RepID=UPI003D25E50B